MSTTAIILAADCGIDFPGPKYLASVLGEPMLQVVVDRVKDWPVDNVVVVLGADAAEIVETIDFRGMTVVIDPEWSEGNASPIRAALDLVSRDRSTDRCVIAWGDQPVADIETVQALLDVALESGADAVVPKYRYAVGWPVILDYSMWERLLGSEGSVDILAVVASHAVSVEEVWFDNVAPTIYATAGDLPQARR